MNILLCDDHRLLLEALSASLAAHDHRVVGALTDPDSIVSAALDLTPDVCIIDVAFPEGSGIDAVRELVRQVPGTRVLMLSASTDSAAIRRSLEAGALGFVRKDDSIAGILEAIRHLMDGEVAIEPRLLQAAMREPDGARRPVGGRAGGYLLTKREQTVLELIVDGRNTTEIAEALSITTSTARTHIQNVLIKTGVHSRLQAASLAVREGLVRTAS